MPHHINGTLFQYSANVAFCADGARGRIHGCKHLVLVGGLTDGLLNPKYSILLAESLAKEDWCLVQPLLSSSYQGFGVSSLDKDAEELHLLIESLNTEFASKGIVLMGHSTGCQDAVRFVDKFSNQEHPLLLGIVLQAPVSDREWLATKESTPALIRDAKAMVEAGKGEEILFRDHEGGNGAPVCARRFLSLADRGGDDDMFSSDYSDGELKERLGHCHFLASLVLVSGSDEYMPAHVQHHSLAIRLSRALGPKSVPVVIENGVHDLAGSEDALLHHVLCFLQRIA
ncbi:UPF0613 protein PB24D3.06c [Coccomyxa sp. Obi]|nr:UPF0613 protein PB24D3.06c [Coccomyxa sp. Obi]